MNRKAFTLVELLIAVAIIGIIGAAIMQMIAGSGGITVGAINPYFAALGVLATLSIGGVGYYFHNQR